MEIRLPDWAESVLASYKINLECVQSTSKDQTIQLDCSLLKDMAVLLNM